MVMLQEPAIWEARLRASFDVSCPALYDLAKGIAIIIDHGGKTYFPFCVYDSLKLPRKIEIVEDRR